MPAPDSDVITSIIHGVYYVGQCSILAPVFIGFRRWPFLASDMRVMLYCCLMWTVMSIVGEVCRHAFNYNLIVWQLVDVFDIWFIGGVYYYTLQFGFKRYFLLIGVLYTLFAFVDMFVINDILHGMKHGLVTGNNYTLVVKHILLVSMILLYFEQSLRHLRNVVLERDPIFLISVALLVFYAGTLVLFLVRNNVSVSMKSYILTIPILTVLNFLLNSTLAWAFWLAGKKQKQVLEPAPSSRFA